MQKLIFTFILILLSQSNIAQEKWAFIGYDTTEKFSNLCNNESIDYGGAWVYKNENYADNKKAVIQKFEETKNTRTTLIGCTEGEGKVIAIVKSTTYCSGAKRDYSATRFIYGNSLEAIKKKIASNEKLHSNTKLRQTIIKTIFFDKVVNTLDTNAQIIAY